MDNGYLHPKLYIAFICFFLSVSVAQHPSVTKCVNDLAARNPNSGLIGCSPQGSPNGCDNTHPCKTTTCSYRWMVTGTPCGICVDTPKNVGQTCSRSDYSAMQPSFCDAAFGSYGKCDDAGKCVSSCGYGNEGRCSDASQTCVVGCPGGDHGSQIRYSNIFGSGAGMLDNPIFNVANDIAILPKHIVTVGSTLQTQGFPSGWNPLYNGYGINAYVMTSTVHVTAGFNRERTLVFGSDSYDTAKGVAYASDNGRIIVVGTTTQTNGSVNFPAANCNKIGMQTWIMQWSDVSLQTREFGFCIGKANTTAFMDVTDIAVHAQAFYVVGSQTAGLTGWSRVPFPWTAASGSTDAWVFRFSRVLPLVSGVPAVQLAVEFGGNGNDAFDRIVLTNAGPYDFYIGGMTTSSNLPVVYPYCTQGTFPGSLGFVVAGSNITRLFTSYMCNTVASYDADIAIREYHENATDLYLMFRSSSIPSWYYPTGTLFAPTGTSTDSVISIIRDWIPNYGARTILAGTIIRGITPKALSVDEEVQIVGSVNGPLPVSINSPFGAASVPYNGTNVAYYRLAPLLGKISSATVLRGSRSEEPRAVQSYRGFTDPTLAGKLPSGVVIAGSTSSPDFPKVFAETSGSPVTGGSFLTAIDNTCYYPEYKARVQTPSSKVLSNEYLSTYEGPAVPVYNTQRTRVYILSAGIAARTANQKMDYEVFRTPTSTTTDPNGVGTYLANVINSIARQTNFININIDLTKASSTSNFYQVTTELQTALQRVYDDLAYIRVVTGTNVTRNVVVIPYTFRLDTRLCPEINSVSPAFIMGRFEYIHNLSLALQKDFNTTIVAATGDFGDAQLGNMASYYRYPLQNYAQPNSGKNRLAIFVSALEYKDYFDLTSVPYPGASTGRFAFWADGIAQRQVVNVAPTKFTNRYTVPPAEPISGSPVAAAITAAIVSTIQQNTWPISQDVVAQRIGYQLANGLVPNYNNMVGLSPPVDVNNLLSAKVEPWRPCQGVY